MIVFCRVPISTDIRNRSFFFCLCWRDFIDAMNITYEITEETYSLGTSTRTSYGITAYSRNNEHGTTVTVATVHDITADKQALTEFVALCNRLELSAIHFRDVIDDYLAR